MKFTIPLICLIAILLFFSAIPILGHILCMGEGCCYSDPQDIAEAEAMMQPLIYGWIALATVNTALFVLTLILLVRKLVRKRKKNAMTDCA